MSIEYHKHCQITVLPANGTYNQNGASWATISELNNGTLHNLPANWLDYFKENTQNITQDIASIIKLIDIACNDTNYVHKSGDETINGKKIFTDLVIQQSPDSSATGSQVVDANWVRNYVSNNMPAAIVESNYVHTKNAETIGGVKQFTDSPTFSSGMTVNGTATFQNTINGTAMRALWGDIIEFNDGDCCQLKYDDTGCPGMRSIYQYLLSGHPKF